jgi:hypothetical protein
MAPKPRSTTARSKTARSTTARSTTARSKTARSKTARSTAVRSQIVRRSKSIRSSKAPVRRSRSKSARKRSSRRKTLSRSSQGEDLFTQAEYDTWEQTVIGELQKTPPSALRKAGKVCVLRRLFIVLDGDRSNWETVSVKRGKKNVSMHQMFDIFKKEMEYVPSYELKPRGSTPLKRYIATDLRGLTYYYGSATKPEWGKSPALVMQGGKALDEQALATKVMAAFQSLREKSLKKPAAETTALVARWLQSAHAVMGAGDTVNIRFAYARFDANREPTRSQPSRLFVPAAKVHANATTKNTYLTFARRQNKERTYRNNTAAECANKYLAVDVDDAGLIPERAHLSTNEPGVVVQHMAVAK